MKYFIQTLTGIIFFLFISSPSISQAQIKGNGQLATFSQKLNNVQTIKLDFPAKVIVDCEADEQIDIRTDENIVDYIDIRMDGNTLIIHQGEWIEASRPIQILIGAPKLERIQTSGYSDVIVENIDTDFLNVQAIVGNMLLTGRVDEFRLGTETGYIDASRLASTKVFANVWGRGVADVHPIDMLYARVNSGSLIYHNNPNKLDTRTQNKAKIYSIDEADQFAQKVDESSRYIDVAFRNNSGEKIDVYVKGPKEKKFSYGIPFKSKQVRQERFPVGTKIYLVGPIGNRRLLVTVRENDENQTINLLE